MLEILIKMWYTFFEVVVMIHSIQSCAFSGHRPKSFSFGYDETSVDFQVLRSKMFYFFGTLHHSKNILSKSCLGICVQVRTFFERMQAGINLGLGHGVILLRSVKWFASV